jgi:hypothetical protein
MSNTVRCAWSAGMDCTSVGRPSWSMMGCGPAFLRSAQTPQKRFGCAGGHRCLFPPTFRSLPRPSWSAYVNRWPVEQGIRFCQEGLRWTRPRFQRAERGERWTCLVILALWGLYLARQIVEDTPLP